MRSSRSSDSYLVWANFRSWPDVLSGVRAALQSLKILGLGTLLSSQKYRRQMDARKMSEGGQDFWPRLEADC